MPGQQSSAIFLQKLSPLLRRPWLGLKRRLLSSGCVGYYLNTASWHTRLHLHNYFSLLHDAPFRAKWEVLFYKQNGDFVRRMHGAFEGAETVVIDVSTVSGLDPLGIVYVHIRDADTMQYLTATYGSIFFTEYYRPGTDQNVILHGLAGAPRASHYMYRVKSTSWVTPSGFRPHLLIANACDFQSLMHPVCGYVSIMFTNDANQSLSAPLPPLRGRACQDIDLYALMPTLEEHLHHRPFTMEIYGKNFMSKPVLFQTDGHRALVEHS